VIGPKGPDGKTKGKKSERGVAQRLPSQVRRPGHQVLRNQAGSVMRQDEGVFDHESTQGERSCIGERGNRSLDGTPRFRVRQCWPEPT
jgi:hypothetical protein